MFITVGGVYLGNPRDATKRVEVYVDKTKIQRAENISQTPEALAVNLLLALFTDDELRKGNCTTPRRKDIVLLDQNRVQAIRGMAVLWITAISIS